MAQPALIRISEEHDLGLPLRSKPVPDGLLPWTWQLATASSDTLLAHRPEALLFLAASPQDIHDWRLPDGNASTMGRLPFSDDELHPPGPLAPALLVETPNALGRTEWD